MAQDRANPKDGGGSSYQKVGANTHYALLKIDPSASVKQIRQAYRELSKLYHPDTTTLPTAMVAEASGARLVPSDQWIAAVAVPSSRRATAFWTISV